MKKGIVLFLSMILILAGFSCPVYAVDDEYCNEHPDEDDCIIYRASKSKETIDLLYQQIEEAGNDLEKAQQLATSYREKADELNDGIASLTKEISELTVKRDELIVRIDENQALVDKLNKRVLTRMADSQGTMHFNSFLDFLLGSEGFSDMSRRIYGIQAINSKEKAQREELIDIITQLESDKAELDESKSQLDQKKDELVDKQAEYLVMQRYYNEIAEETATLIEDYRNRLEEETQNYNDLRDRLSEEDVVGLPSSYGFSSPVPGAKISASVWHYPASFGGGVHLGVDYAVKIGTTIYAPANGLIIISDDNCPTYGYLGNSCGGKGGGVSYGGNQIYMICSVNNVVYAITFSHLYSGSLTSTGVVMAGDPIARVGSSGNSTGAHCHIELYWLGEGSMDDIYNDYLKRNYSLSFNCNWGNAALSNTCDRKGSPPCRLDPSKYFGS